MNLTEHNRRVREWAESQPVKYRLSAQAFGYPADKDTCSHDYRLRDIARMSRRRRKGVSIRTLIKHLPAFEACGAITVKRRRSRNRNQSSVYHIDFTKTISEADVEQSGDDWIGSAEWVEQSIPGQHGEPEKPRCPCWWCRNGQPASCYYHPEPPAPGDPWAGS
jgi:hypothetical protein